MATVGPLLVLLPQSYGARHLVLENGYTIGDSRGRCQAREIHDFDFFLIPLSIIIPNPFINSISFLPFWFSPLCTLFLLYALSFDVIDIKLLIVLLKSSVIITTPCFLNSVISF